MVEITADKLWIDGCFDFAHHGHAGAMLQARRLGNELYVGIHSDADIAANKGPTVMSLEERVLAVTGCKWSTTPVPGAPYVTQPAVMDQYGCQFVVHGDDITTDADGNDCYQEVKDLGRFVVVKRTPNISTTDLVGRMLLLTKTHHIPGFSSKQPHPLLTEEAIDKFAQYASAADGKQAHSAVYIYDNSKVKQIVSPSLAISTSLQNPTQRIFYVDGGFDLFFMGHIECLRLVHEAAQKENALIVVAIHDDYTVNQYKKLNYPIMNLQERALCVLQCKYVDTVILGAPYVPTKEFLDLLPFKVTDVFHGPTEVASAGTEDPYKDIKDMGIYRLVGEHKYKDVSTATIVDRVLKNREVFEARQRKKGWKSEREKVLELAEKNSR
ncbi:Nucleotidylyl transferase [Nadsonia fulvescens var. elongata DSM 6958]|uniref:ethanolamine-phosphate cytidylyltransferase n=1 Tax=Nadsonia fulvescens var. elongata DSM 6958 TaxID=857566 RepID=A0A1E3PD84_9ASCO|nr:Nucleotidylyl transferase [Nadsonia fulvescens var. elongata DSM 6958]